MHYPRPRVLQQRFDQQIDLRPRASPGRLRGGLWRRKTGGAPRHSVGGRFPQTDGPKQQAAPIPVRSICFSVRAN
jgi:hypothetical protein